MKRKIVALTLASVLTASLFTGCGAGEDKKASGNTKAESGETQDGDQTYTMFMRNTYVGWIEELKWYDAAEEATGIHVEYVEGPDDFNDCYAEVDQRIISETLPDAVMTKLTQTNVYGPQGAFVDMAPYIKEYAPNLQKYIDENSDYKALVTDEEGAIYGLVRESPIFTDYLGYRVDQLEEAGIQAEDIKTVNDFTEAMRTLKAHFGKDNPNYYPLDGRENPVRFAAWFGCPSNISSEESNGIYVAHQKDGSLDIMNENAYTMVETMKTWYDEGLINPEFMANTRTEADWEAAMINGNATFEYDYYNRPAWFMENGGTEADPDYQMGVMDMFEDEEGNILKGTTSCKYNEETCTAINAQCSEEKIKTILTFIDYFYSEEGMTLANYGVEGESFEVSEDGTKEFIVDYSEEEATPEGEKRWSFLSDRLTVCKPVDNEAFFKWNTPLIAEAAERINTEENMMESYNIKYTADQTEELSNLVATVFDAEIAGIISFVTGNEELTEESWKAFQEEMNSLGLSRIEEIQLEAFQATFGK